MKRVAAAVMAIAVVGAPYVAHADAAGPTDYVSTITAVAPATVLDVLSVDIVGGDAFVRIDVAGGHEVIVLGYLPDQEPYLRVSADGTVAQNRKSLATYYNQDRDGTTAIPDVVDTTAPPDWEIVGDGGTFAWHDHRAHWMGSEPLLGLDAGESLPAEQIPLLVDGIDATITVVTTLQPPPSKLPALAGGLFGCLVGLLGLAFGRATTTLVALVLATAALAAGLAQFWSLPATTGPSTSWWLLPAVALACALIVVAMYRRSIWIEVGLLAIAGAQLLLWGWNRRLHAVRAYVPTSMPADLDRAITMAATVGAVFVLIAAGRVVADQLRPAQP